MAISAPIRPSIALAAFAEKFIEGRRVLVFGNALSPFWEQLIERGARLVHVCDSDASRVAEAAARNTSQNVSFAPLSGTTLAVRDGAFDVGFIDNLASLPEPAQALHKLKRALSARGVALVAAPNPDLEQPLIGSSIEPGQALDYYSLYDHVHREFSVVRMVGQMPFVGYSVAELAPAEEPQPSLDAGFVPGGTEEPEWFIAVGSQTELEFDAFVVVQLPHSLLQQNGADRILREQLRSARSAERNAVERLSRLEADQKRVSEVAERHHKDVDLARQMRLLQEELERKESWILQLEARASTADARADEADQELDELREQLEANRAGKTAVVAAAAPPTPAELEAKKAELSSARNALTSALTAHATAQTELAALQAELNSSRSALMLAHTELTTSHTELTTSHAKLATLQAELATARARAQTLEQSLNSQAKRLADADSGQSQISSKLLKATGDKEQLAAQTAELQAQVTTLNQRITELSSQLGATDPEIENELERLEAQLVERGERIRQLENELAKTERFGRTLVRDLERARTLARSAAVSAQVATVSTESWTQGPTLSSATTEQNPAQVSAWTEPATETHASSTQIQELRDKLDRLAALAARQQADLTVSTWQLEQIQAENQDLRQEAAASEALSAELSACRTKLQETEVVLAQIRWREATASDNGPVR